MKYFKKITSLSLALVLLSGCIRNVEPEEDTTQDSNTVPVQTTSTQISDNYYRSVIVDGKYQLGAAASADNNINSHDEQRAFENGLLRISQEVFPTNQYYLQEGQIIDENTLNSWLERESEENPEGLNPEIPQEIAEQQESMEESEPVQDEESSNEESSQESTQVEVSSDIPPIYLSNIIEKNLMTETEEGFALSGIAIGLAMNSNYTYTDSDGVVHNQEISVGEMRERGRQYANIIVGRLRNTEELRSIPIVVGIYSMSNTNDLAPGTYIIDGISREGNSITDWQEHNEYRVALPIVDPDNQSDEYLYFDNFRREIQNFFPNLNGISGDALYIDGGLASLDIEIVTQFYQKTEIIALTQYVMEVAHQQLPENVQVEININSAAGNEAIITRPSGSGQFTSTVAN